jgi:DNA-binding CsgD family transcriptional regulator/tetratricopeptide (TPR) repeat protein
MGGVQTSTARLVGRAAELELLEEALGAAAARGSTVLVAGDAGVGKTRLVTELANRAHAAGATVLAGRCIDLVGAGLPYLPFVEALRPAGGLPAGADVQARLFEETLAALERTAAGAPVLLVLEDLHWADDSTLDLVAFLAHAIHERPILVVATYRSDELRADDPPQRVLAELVRAGAATLVALRPFDRDDLHALLENVAGERVPRDLTAAIHARSEGNAFFAEELLAAAARGEEELSHVLRDVLLRRLARVDRANRSVLRLAAAAGGDVTFRLLAAVAERSDVQLLDGLRDAVENGVLSSDQSASTFRFRHALLAEAMYGTLLPGEREDVHRRLAEALAADRTLAAARGVAGELAHHWTVAGRPREALAASVEAAREAESMSGLAEALRHLERVLALWERLPDAVELAGLDHETLLAWAAEVADRTGNAPRATQLARRAIEALAGADPVRVARLWERLGTYLLHQGDEEGARAAFRRAADMVPDEPPSAERAGVLAALANVLQRPGRHAESLAVCEEAVQVAEAAGAERAAIRALTVRGLNLCYLGRAEEGIACLVETRRRAEERGSPEDVTHAYISLCDVLITSGRLHDAARTAFEGLEFARRHGLERGHGVALAVNAADALIGTGDWTRADDVLAAAFRAGGLFWGDLPHMFQAQLDTARGELESARRHLEAAKGSAAKPWAAVRYGALVAELALWEGRLDAAAEAVDDALRAASLTESGYQRPQLCALGVRIEAERTRLAAVRRDDQAPDEARRRAERLLEDARRSAREAAAVAPDAAAWAAVAEAEHGRVAGPPSADAWCAAVAAFDALDRPYVAAYCRWREAEALAGTREAAEPARAAHRVARWLGARALQQQVELLAQRARIDLAEPEPPATEDDRTALAEALGLTAREAEVLELVVRGYTNREIGAALYVSAKTASVHVSHILRKLGTANRVEAAAIAQQVMAGPRR